MPQWEALALVRRPADPKNDDELNAIRCRPAGRETLTSMVTANSWCKATGGKFSAVDMLMQRGLLPLRFRVGDDGPAVGFLGDTSRDAVISGEQPLFKHLNGAPLVGWSARGDGHVNYVLSLGPAGFSIRPLWGDSSDRARITQYVKTAAMVWGVGFAFAGAGSLGSFLGEKIVGTQFAASYPGVTAAIGNTALGTAMNGGDVESAVKGAVISSGAGAIGVQVGTQVAQVTDIQAIGRIAQAATTAYIRGGDVDAAVRFALVQSIPDAFPSAFQEQSSMNLSISDWPAANDWQVAADPWGVSSMPGVAAPEFTPLPSVLEFTDPAPVFTTDAPASGSWWRDTFTRENVRAARDVVTDVAAIVGTVRAVENMNDPRPAPAPRAAVQSTVQTIRNPDGSLTRVAADGSVQVISAEQARRIMNPGLQLSPTVLALGGAALLGVLFLATRKR